MPPLERISLDRIQFQSSLTSGEVDSLVVDADLRVLQTSLQVEDDTWDLLNEVLFASRDDITLRLYGFYSSVCDLSFLSRLPNVQRFSADSLMRAIHVEHVASLPNLKALSIGIYSLERFDFLDDIQPENLTELSLSATKSKKPSVASLSRFAQLRTLYLEGQQKGIEAISQLAALEDLTLRSITVPRLDFLRSLKRLWSLDIKLGGTNNLEDLEGLIGIKYLELWQIRDLRDIDVISTLLGLQYLFLQALPHIEAIPDLSKLPALRRVYLENMKGLKDLSGLAKAPALEEFIHVAAQGLKPAHYHDLLGSKSLKSLMVGFGSMSKNDALRRLVAEAGIGHYSTSKFMFT